MHAHTLTQKATYKNSPCSGEPSSYSKRNTASTHPHTASTPPTHSTNLPISTTHQPPLPPPPQPPHSIPPPPPQHHPPSPNPPKKNIVWTRKCKEAHIVKGGESSLQRFAQEEDTSQGIHVEHAVSIGWVGWQQGVHHLVLSTHSTNNNVTFSWTHPLLYEILWNKFIHKGHTVLAKFWSCWLLNGASDLDFRNQSLNNCGIASRNEYVQ